MNSAAGTWRKATWPPPAKHLNELFNQWNLQPEFYKETVRMLLDVHLQQGPPSQVVKYFEIIIEKFPELEILVRQAAEGRRRVPRDRRIRAELPGVPGHGRGQFPAGKPRGRLPGIPAASSSAAWT